MGELLNIALAAAEASTMAGRRPRRSAVGVVISIALVVVVTASVFGAVLCGLVSLWIYELPRMGPVGAPLAVAAVLVAAALIGCTVLWYHLTPRQPPQPSPDPEAILANMSELVKTHKMPTLVAAFFAGLSAGAGK